MSETRYRVVRGTGTRTTVVKDDFDSMAEATLWAIEQDLDFEDIDLEAYLPDAPEDAAGPTGGDA